MRILIVEDNADVASSLANLLRADGHDDVSIAHDAASALASMRAALPELVLCDLGLPGRMDGLALARTCRAEFAGRPLRMVALSGYGPGDVRQRALEAGFDDLLGKPVSFGQLADCVAGRKT